MVKGDHLLKKSTWSLAKLFNVSTKEIKNPSLLEIAKQSQIKLEKDSENYKNLELDCKKFLGMAEVLYDIPDSEADGNSKLTHTKSNPVVEDVIITKEMLNLP